jgi:O-antigen ligase
VLASPRNGLTLLLVLPPFFNGEDERSYFFLLEVLVYATLARGLVAYGWHRRRPMVPHAPLLALLFLSTVVSLPLDLKELWLEGQVSTWREIVEGVRRSVMPSTLFYVRTILNVGSGIGLYIIVVNERWTPDAVRRFAWAATLACAAVNVVGLWLYWFPLAANRVFLTLWLGGENTSGFPGLGFNVTLFAQYSIAYLPLAALVLVQRGPSWQRVCALLVVLLGACTLVVTYQRAALILLGLELGLTWCAARALAGTATGRARLVSGTVAGVVLVVSVLLSFTPTGPRVGERILALVSQGDAVRVEVLRATGRMLRDYPVLGIGSGRFARFFEYYSPTPEMQFGSWSTHNLYVQFLAEQGVLGLTSFLALLAVVLVPIVRRQGRLGGERPAVLFLLVSLGSWLAFGLLQYTFQMRSMQVYFWIVLGLLVALTRAVAPPVRVPGTWMVAVLIGVTVAAGLRAHAVVTRPLPAGYTWGFHDWEPAGIRWTRGGAVTNLAVRGRTVRLALAFPVPAARTRPQVVSIWLDGRPARQITLERPEEWKIVDLPVAGPIGRDVLLQLRTGYAFVPATSGLGPDTRRLGVMMRPITWLE